MALDDLACFWDYSSLFQFRRNPAEEACFQRALPNITLWYTHPESLIFALTTAFAGVKPYSERGWTTFEFSVASILVDLCFVTPDASPGLRRQKVRVVLYAPRCSRGIDGKTSRCLEQQDVLMVQDVLV